MRLLDGRRVRAVAGRRGSGRRPLQAALGLLVVMALAACGGLPTSGDIQRGLPVRGEPVQGVQVLPDGPADDADREDIVTGFLRANVGFTDDHEVARSFLTPSLAAEWRPTSRVLVHSGETDFELTTPDASAVTVTATVEASLDEDGYFRQLAVGSNTAQTFGLEQVEGQWRISSFPDDFGLWLSEPDFDRLYTPATITYVSPVNRLVVPDVRWFPRGAGLGTTLARAQVQEVPAYLRGAAVSGVPSGTHLAVDAVPVEDGVAMVDLAGGGLGDGPEGRRALWAQFVHTLTQVPGVRQVSLQAGGRPLEAPGATGPLADAQEVGYTEAQTTVPFALLRTGTTLQRVNPYQADLGQHQPAQGADLPELPEIPDRWRDLAAGPEVAQLAAVSGDRTAMARWRDGELHQMPSFGQGLTRPSFDHLGGLWVAGASASGSKVWVIDTAVPVDRSVARPVEAPWIGEREVVAFRVAADNQRAVIVTRDPRSDQYDMGITGIVRSADGQPRSLTSPMPIGPPLATITDVSWLDQTTVAVLGRGGTSDVAQPYVLPLSGFAEPVTALEGARAIVGVPGTSNQQLLVVTDRGRISTRDGAGWYTSRVGSDLVVPGT